MGRSVAVVRAALLVAFAVVPAMAQVGPRRLVVSAANSTIPVGQAQNLTMSAAFFRSYAATLALWFGVPSGGAGSISSIFPNLGNFSAPKLVFLG